MREMVSCLITSHQKEEKLLLPEKSQGPLQKLPKEWIVVCTLEI